MLALAEQINNVGLARERSGISRSHDQEIKEAFERLGAAAEAQTAHVEPDASGSWMRSRLLLQPEQTMDA